MASRKQELEHPWGSITVNIRSDGSIVVEGVPRYPNPLLNVARATFFVDTQEELVELLDVLEAEAKREYERWYRK